MIVKFFTKIIDDKGGLSAKRKRPLIRHRAMTVRFANRTTVRFRPAAADDLMLNTRSAERDLQFVGRHRGFDAESRRRTKAQVDVVPENGRVPAFFSE